MAEKENVITHTYDLLKYIIPQLAKFPRTQKFVLADRIQNQLTDILDLLIEAFFLSRQDKEGILKRANIEVEKLRYYIRLAHDMRCLNLRRYEFIQEKLNEIGGQLGGWIKSLR